MSSAVSERTSALHSIGARVSGFYVLLFLGSSALLFVLADFATARTLEKRDEALLRAEVERQRERLQGDDESQAPAASDQLLFVRVVSRDHTLVRRGPPEAPRDGELDLPSGREQAVITQVVTAESVRWTVASRRVDDAHVVQVGMSEASRKATLHALRVGYAWVLGGAALIGVLGGLWLMQRALRPIRQLAETTRRVVDEGDLSARVPLRQSADELDALGVLFNEMLARNQRLVSGMREALDHVAHDLRTPLTRLRGTAEVALSSDDPGSQREALADVIEESDQVLAMLRTLMDISEAEAGVLRLSCERLDLGDLARDVIDLYAHVAEDAEISLRFLGEENVWALADRVRLRQALANLVDNAIKYTRAGGHVTIAARRSGERAELVVRDDGIGIAPEAISRLWDRLFRAEPSRSRPGLGLGLSLVKAIAEAHGGSASVESEPGRGSTFTLSLPAV